MICLLAYTLYDNISAFSLSLLVNLDLGSSGCRAKSPMPILVFLFRVYILPNLFQALLSFFVGKIPFECFLQLVSEAFNFISHFIISVLQVLIFLPVRGPLFAITFCTIYVWTLSWVFWSGWYFLFSFFFFLLHLCINCSSISIIFGWKKFHMSSTLLYLPNWYIQLIFFISSLILSKSVLSYSFRCFLLLLSMA